MIVRACHFMIINYITQIVNRQIQPAPHPARAGGQHKYSPLPGWAGKGAALQGRDQMISTKTGLGTFTEAAFTTVRMALAMRPCLPITLPKINLVQ